jgi:hypothetical protein
LVGFYVPAFQLIRFLGCHAEKDSPEQVYIFRFVEDGMKSSRNRQPAVELSGNDNSPDFYPHFYQYENISAETSEK